MLYTGDARRLVALSAPDVRALTDGRTFLDRAPALRAIDLEPYCVVCGNLGLDPSVVLTHQTDQILFRCGHTHGAIRRDRPLEVAPLLHACRWNVRCVRCQAPVRADNAPDAEHFTVDCPCTTRQMANPLSASERVSRVDRLDRPQSLR